MVAICFHCSEQFLSIFYNPVLSQNISIIITWFQWNIQLDWDDKIDVEYQCQPNENRLMNIEEVIIEMTRLFIDEPYRILIN